MAMVPRQKVDVVLENAMDKTAGGAGASRAGPKCGSVSSTSCGPRSRYDTA